jgi:RimJ/RimL family protein N-acetyltransferase
MSWIIRKANETDAEALIAYMQELAQEPGVHLPLRPGTFELTPEQEREWIRQHTEQDNALLLVVEAEGEIVGVLHCEGSADLFTRHNVTFGVSLRADYRGRGIGTQLINECLAWAHSKPYVRRVQLEVFANNEAAIQLYERMGFLTEGWRARSYYIDDHYVDTYLMSQQIA